MASCENVTTTATPAQSAVVFLAKYLIFLEVLAAHRQPGQPFSSGEFEPLVSRIIDYQVKPRFRDPIFLHQKYIVEGRSIAQIATEIFSSKSAVREALIEFGIPVRESCQPHGRPAQPRFGRRYRGGKIQDDQAELRVAKTIDDLRARGMGLREIARTLTS